MPTNTAPLKSPTPLFFIFPVCVFIFEVVMINWLRCRQIKGPHNHVFLDPITSSRKNV